MLIIRDEQMDALRRRASDDFIRRCARRLRWDFPVSFAGTPESSLTGFVRYGLALGARLELRRETQIHALLVLSVLHGPGLFRDPDARARLTATGVPGNERIASLAALGFRTDVGEDDGRYGNMLLLFRAPGHP